MRSGVSTTSKVPGSTCRSSATGEGGPRTGTRVAVAAALAAFAALAGAFAAALARPGCDDVVDAEDHDRRVGGRGDGLAADPNRFDHVLLLHVGDLAGEDVDPRVLVALLVLLPELDQDVDRV